MTTSSRVYSLRINREIAGNVFPFDRVYLTSFDSHAVFKRLFQYALVMPLDETLMGVLKGIDVEVEKEICFHRTYRPPPSLPNASFLHRLFETADSWVMCVPLLTRRVSPVEIHARYLTATGKYMHPLISPYTTSITGRRSRRRWKNTIPDPFPAYTYLQTPTQDIRPVCTACPNIIQFYNGECRLGVGACYNALNLKVVT